MTDMSLSQSKTRNNEPSWMRAEPAAANRSHLATGQKSSVNGHGKKQWPEVIFLLFSEPLCHLIPEQLLEFYSRCLSNLHWYFRLQQKNARVGKDFLLFLICRILLNISRVWVIKRWFALKSAVKRLATHVGQCSNCYLRGPLEESRLFQLGPAQPTPPIIQPAHCRHALRGGALLPQMLQVL